MVFALIPGIDRGTVLQTVRETGDVAPIVHAFHRAFLVASFVAAGAAAIATRMPSRSLWSKE